MQRICGISPPFGRLSPTLGQIPTYYSPVRHFTRELPLFLVRLACVRHAASVQSEPGSNSSIKKLALRGWTKAYPHKILARNELLLNSFRIVESLIPIFNAYKNISSWAPTQIVFLLINLKNYPVQTGRTVHSTGLPT